MKARTSAQTLTRRLFLLLIVIAGSFLAGQQVPAAGAVEVALSSVSRRLSITPPTTLD